MVPQWAPKESMYILLDFLYGDKPQEFGKATHAFWGNNAEGLNKQTARKRHFDE